MIAMKRLLLLLAVYMSAISVFADKLPKSVEKARNAVASVVTYKQGVLLNNGTAVFVGDKGELLSSRSLFVGADSAVVIDVKGVVHPVKHILGVNEILDCIRVRVAPSKKIKSLPVSLTPVADDELLYLLGYGMGKGGFVENTIVERVDSIYSCAYYTLKKPMESRFLSLPIVNARGEFVAMMQPAATGDTINSYAIGASVLSMLEPTVATYGRGFYHQMGIRTALPSSKENALSCLYMQAMVGDSVSYRSVIDEFIANYPDSYEGYISKAEYEALFLRDMELAEQSWSRALKLSNDAAEVHFGKAKVINAILLAGDSISHPSLSFENALAEFDRAIELGNQSLYVAAKADMLFSHGRFTDAAKCYESLSVTDVRGPETFAKAAKCYNEVGNYEKSVALLDSAVNCFDESSIKSAAPYILTRALVYSAAEKYRNAILDFNRYEELVSTTLGADFYYLRSQVELKAKMYQLALNDIDTAISLAPHNVSYYIEKGVLCYRVKFSEEGLRVLKEAEALAPQQPDIHYLLGRLYMQKGDSKEATSCLKKAIELGHPDAEAVLKQIVN